MAKKPKELSPGEEAVRARLQDILCVDVQQLDDNTVHSTPDLKIVYPDDRPFAPVEVTNALDEEEEKATNDKGFEPWQTTTLTRSWTLVSDGPPPRWKDLRLEAEPLLRHLEQSGVYGFEPATRMQLEVRAAATQAEPEVSIWRTLARLAELRVHQGQAFARERGPHTIGVGLGRGGTWGFTADAIAHWVTEFVNDQKRQDNVIKLDRGGDEAHLAIRVHLNGAGFAVYQGIIDQERHNLLPTDDPEVPSTITDLWLAVSFNEGDVLHWQRGAGWTRHESRTRPN